MGPRLVIVFYLVCGTASAGLLLRGNSLPLPDGTTAPLASYPGGFTPFGGRFAMSMGMSGYSGGIASASRSRMDVAADARSKWDAHIKTLEEQLKASPGNAALTRQLQQARNSRAKADNEYHAALRDNQQANGLSGDANKSANATCDGAKCGGGGSGGSSSQMSAGTGLMIGLAAGGIVAGGLAAAMSGAPKTNDGFEQKAAAERQQIAQQNQRQRDRMAAQTFANQQNQIARLNASQRAEQDRQDQASLVRAISSTQNNQSGGLNQQLSTLSSFPGALMYGPTATNTATTSSTVTTTLDPAKLEQPMQTYPTVMTGTSLPVRPPGVKKAPAPKVLLTSLNPDK